MSEVKIDKVEFADQTTGYQVVGEDGQVIGLYKSDGTEIADQAMDSLKMVLYVETIATLPYNNKLGELDPEDAAALKAKLQELAAAADAGGDRIEHHEAARPGGGRGEGASAGAGRPGGSGPSGGTPGGTPPSAETPETVPVVQEITEAPDPNAR